MTPSFGFIIGFVFAAYVVGKIAHSDNGLSKKRIWIGSIVGSVVIYLFGLPYMYYMLNIVMGNGFSFLNIMQMGCFMFLPGDLAKLVVSSLLGVKILPLLNNLGLTTNSFNTKNN